MAAGTVGRGSGGGGGGGGSAGCLLAASCTASAAAVMKGVGLAGAVRCAFSEEAAVAPWPRSTGLVGEVRGCMAAPVSSLRSRMEADTETASLDLGRSRVSCTDCCGCSWGPWELGTSNFTVALAGGLSWLGLPSGLSWGGCGTGNILPATSACAALDGAGGPAGGRAPATSLGRAGDGIGMEGRQPLGLAGWPCSPGGAGPCIVGTSLARPSWALATAH